jgi:SAM-dependent methyltransferase
MSGNEHRGVLENPGVTEKIERSSGGRRMARVWDSSAFDRTYAEALYNGHFPFGTPEYYARYRSRYRMLLERFAELAPHEPVDVLDVGGGQLALLAKMLWNDRSWVSDLPGQPQLEYLRPFGVESLAWNLCSQEQPCTERFDFIFFSEVIEHLPIPGHVVLERLRLALRPGGILICSTPNLYRPRNVVHLALGLPIFDNMQVPGAGSLGHVIEYSRDGLQWQFEKAGFTDCNVEYRQMHHSPTNPLFRVMSWIGYPLFLIPRFRDNLLAVGSSPAGSKSRAAGTENTAR